MAKTYRAKTSFSFDHSGGISRVVAVDEAVSSDDPAFKKRQDLFANAELFEAMDDYLERRTAGPPAMPTSAAVEQTTAAPGEKRTTRRPAAKATKDEGEG